MYSCINILLSLCNVNINIPNKKIHKSLLPKRSNVENPNRRRLALHRNLNLKLFFNMLLRKVLLRKEFLWKNQKSPAMNKPSLSQEDEEERACIRKAILRQRSIPLAAPSSSSAATPSTDMVVAPTASDSSLPVAQHDISMAKTNKNKDELVVDGYGYQRNKVVFSTKLQENVTYWKCTDRS